MQVYYADHHEVPLPEGHRFPMTKYRLLRQALVDRGVVRPCDLHPSEPAAEELLLLCHTPDYVAGMLGGTADRRVLRGLGFPWSEALLRRSRASVAGTVAAARAALRDGVAGNLAGGTHHAFADRGEGYCVFNDLAITCRLLLREGAVRRLLVIDLDVHQGNGTAALLRDEPRAFTCSLHGEKNYPFRKERSDLDVPLPDGVGDDGYLAALGSALAQALAQARPELILYQAGVDPLRQDRLGRLGLSHEGLRARDLAVLRAAARAGVPVALTLGGGYAEPIEATVEAHLGTYLAAREVFGPPAPAL